MKKTAITARIGLGFVFMLLMINIITATALPEGYTYTTNYTSLTYDIEETNGLVALPTDTPNVWTNVSNEVGGSIELEYSEFYDVWGTMHPSFNITVKYANGDTNHTVANVSDSDLDMTFILGFYPFSGGFILPTNWTANDQLAADAANAPPGTYSSNGTLSITSEKGVRTYDYVQNPSYGNMEAHLKYNEDTGVLIEFDSSFLDYHMKAELDTGGLNIPGFSWIFLLGASAFSIGAIIYKKKR